MHDAAARLHEHHAGEPVAVDGKGRRIALVFLTGYALFGLACFVAAFSPSSEALIAARALMGIGAAGLALGPIMGGLLLDRFWWGSVFFVKCRSSPSAC